MDKQIYDDELERLQLELVQCSSGFAMWGIDWSLCLKVETRLAKVASSSELWERVSPRVFNVVALPAPTERERTQYYLQRYIEHLPAAGEVVLFDRSWYNRAGVERVMGFCSEQESADFLRMCPIFEATLVNSGIQLIKYFLM